MTILSLVALFSVAVSGANASESEEDYRTAISELARFDLGSISRQDAANWVVIRTLPDESSGALLGAGVMISKTGQIVQLGDHDRGVIAKGKWELVAPLVPVPHQVSNGTYDWLDKDEMSDDVYHPFQSGGTVLSQYFPEKKGAAQFARTVLLPADIGKWIPAAYEFRQKNATVFGEKFDEHALMKLLGDKNPMIAIMAAQRLARGRRLSSAATDAMLVGPADFRRGLAFYLRLTPVGSRTNEVVQISPLHPKEPPKGEAWVTPGMKSAIGSADGAMLRCYVLASIQASEFGGRRDYHAASPALKLCRQRVEALKLDPEMREELDSLTSAWK